MTETQSLTAGTIFERASKKERRQLDALSTRVRLRAGTMLAREGRRGQEFGVIVDGTATVSVEGDEIARLGAGDHFGEVALLDRAGVGDGHRIASVVADTDVVVAVCTVQEFSGVLAIAPWVVDELLASAADRIAEVPVPQAQPTTA